MAGKMIFVCDDSILGFAFVYLLEQNSMRRTNKRTITKEEFEQLKLNVIEYAKRHGSPDDLIQISQSKKEFFSTQELRTGVRETLFYFNPKTNEYFTNKPLGYLQAAYNRRNADDELIYNMYSNREMLSQLLNPQSVR